MALLTGVATGVMDVRIYYGISNYGICDHSAIGFRCIRGPGGIWLPIKIDLSNGDRLCTLITAE